MKIRILEPFAKQYTKLHPEIRKKVDRRLNLLSKDIRHPGIKAKKMTGVLDIWEGKVNDHYRFTFKIENDTLVMRRVGLHDIYKSP